MDLLYVTDKYFERMCLGAILMGIDDEPFEFSPRKIGCPNPNRQFGR
jgi:hypothetical protein